MLPKLNVPQLSSEYLKKEITKSIDLAPSLYFLEVQFTDKKILKDFHNKDPFRNKVSERNTMFERGPLKIAPVLGKFKESPLKKKRLQ